MKPILSQVEETLQKYKMLSPGEPLLVACSGGADSVALVHFLKELAPRLRIRLSLLHFDHALREESVKDLEWVRRLARRFGLPFYHGRARRALYQKKRNFSPEESARQLRYEFFHRVAKKAKIRKIALAHHKDDQAETVLMRLIQGTGLRGLQGIRPVIRVKGMTLIRPLIELSRREILEFLRKHSISYREDRTNRSKRFLRNRIRNRLLPLLEKEFNPKIRDSLSRLAQTAVRESTGLDEWVSRQGKTYLLRARKNGTVWLDRERFLALPSALQFRLLDQLLHRLDPRSGLDFKSWETIEKGFQKGRVRITLPRNLDLNLTAKKLSLGVCLRRRSEK